MLQERACHPYENMPLQRQAGRLASLLVIKAEELVHGPLNLNSPLPTIYQRTERQPCRGGPTLRHHYGRLMSQTTSSPCFLPLPKKAAPPPTATAAAAAVLDLLQNDRGGGEEDGDVLHPTPRLQQLLPLLLHYLPPLLSRGQHPSKQQPESSSPHSPIPLFLVMTWHGSFASPWT